MDAAEKQVEFAGERNEEDAVKRVWMEVDDWLRPPLKGTVYRKTDGHIATV